MGPTQKKNKTKQISVECVLSAMFGAKLKLEAFVHHEEVLPKSCVVCCLSVSIKQAHMGAGNKPKPC